MTKKTEQKKVLDFLDAQSGPPIIIPKEAWEKYDEDHVMDAVSVRLPRGAISTLKKLDGKGWTGSVRKAVEVYIEYRMHQSLPTTEAKDQ